MRRIGLAFLATVLCAALLLVPPAWAHGGRLPFLFWGNFPRAHLACQRAVGRALSECAVGTLQVIARCSREGADRGACEAGAQAEQLRALMTETLDTIDRFCSDRNAVQLGFLALIEAQADASRACTEVERWARQELPDPASLRSADRACVAFLSQASVKLMRAGTENYRRFFDWLAIHFAPTNKRLRLLDQRRSETTRAVQKLAMLGAPLCAGSAVVQGSLADFFGRVARQAECVVGAAYVQDAVHCDTAGPTPTPTAAATPSPSPTGAPLTPETSG